MNTVFHTTLFCSLLAFAFGASTSVAAGSSDLTGDYNHGVQQYRQSQYDEAAMSFKRAAASSNDALAAKSRYNLGNSLYAKAANLISQPNQDQARLGDAQKSQPQKSQPRKSNLGGSPLSATQSEQDTNPIELLEDAVGAYRSSLRLNPDDEDARFNLENATRLIDQIKEQQSDQNSSRQEQDPDQDQDQDQEQDPSQKQQEENKEDKPEQDSGSKNEKPGENGDSEKPEGEEDAKEKNDPQEGGNEGEDDQKQPQESDQGSPDDQGADDQGADDQGDKPSGETQPDESQQKPGDAQSGSGSSAGQAAAKEMTAQEAKKMLQAIRDRDMQRRDRLESLKRSRRLIVPRDW